jgi:hypothetical protein
VLELPALLRASYGFGVENLFKLPALLGAENGFMAEDALEPPVLPKGEGRPGLNADLPRPSEDELDRMFNLSEVLNPALLDSSIGPPLDELEVLVVGMGLLDPALLDPNAAEASPLEDFEFGFV